LFYSSVAGSLYLQPELLLFSVILELLFCRRVLFQLHPSLSEPLSESPSTIAAVTKDKILSIDLEASSFDYKLYFEDQS
jgi:hypothetical protein